MATITFKHYSIDNMIYRENPNFDEQYSDKLEVNTSPSADIIFQNEYVAVKFRQTIGDETNPSCPFIVDIELIALFEYSVSDNETDRNQLNKLLSQNAIAILFPYIRSIVSDLTLRSNKFPAYVLPTMNVVQLMEKQDKIKIHNSDNIKASDG